MLRFGFASSNRFGFTSVPGGRGLAVLRKHEDWAPVSPPTSGLRADLSPGLRSTARSRLPDRVTDYLGKECCDLGSLCQTVLSNRLGSLCRSSGGLGPIVRPRISAETLIAAPTIRDIVGWGPVVSFPT